MTDLQIIRGDTARFKFQRLDDNGNVILTRADKLYFSVKRTYENSKCFIQKTLADMEFDEDGTYHFTIPPEDTDSAQVNSNKFNNYVYDVEAIQNGVKTTIAFGKFIILPEVTWATNEV